MKKYVSLLAIAALVCVLFAVSCSHGSDAGSHTDPAFLVGTWASDDNGDITFTIQSDLSFECEMEPMRLLPGSQKIKIKGKLDAEASGLGPNDYGLRNLQTTDDNTHPGNTGVASAVEGMNNIVVTLTPNANKTRFTFTSQNKIAHDFFRRDGAFVKQ